MSVYASPRAASAPRLVARGRRSLLAIVAVLGMLASLLVQASPAFAGGPGSTGDPESIVGSVLSADGTTVVPNGRVELTPVGDRYPRHVLHVRADGRFGAPVPAGEYTAVGHPAAHNPSHQAQSKAMSVSIPATGQVSQDLRLRTANLLVTVRRGAAAYVGSPVLARDTATWTATSAISGDDGVAALRVAAGSLSVQADAAGDDLVFGSPKQVTVPESGQGVAEIVLSDPNVSGRIVQPDGSAVTTPPELVVSSTSGGGVGPDTYRALPDGRFGAKLPAGTYTFAARPSADASHTMGRGSRQITLESASLVDQEIRYTTANVVGRLTRTGGAPVAGTRVSVFGTDASSRPFDDATTDGEGWYSLHVPTPGDVFVYARAPQDDHTVTTTRSPVFAVADVDKAVTRDLELLATNVRGTLTAPDGTTPVVGGTVQAFTASGSPVPDAHAMTDASGRFGLRVEAGSFLLRGFPSYYDTAGHRSGELPVDVPAAGVLDGRVLRLTRPTLFGTVRNAAGAPVPFADFRVVDVTRGTLVQVPWPDRPGSNGSWGLALPEGTYRLVATPAVNHSDGSARTDEVRASQVVTVAADEADKQVDLVFGPAAANPVAIERLDVATGGTRPGEGSTLEAALTPDGSKVAFISDRPGLVDEAAPGEQVYLRDRDAGTTVLVSRGLGGDASSVDPDAAAGEVRVESSSVDVSDDGRYVVWTSNADDLVSDDSPGTDVFLRDLVAGRTVRVSVPRPIAQPSMQMLKAARLGSDVQSTPPPDEFIDPSQIEGTPPPGGSGDSEEVPRPPQPDGSSSQSVLSGDGEFVAFTSLASNLDSGDPADSSEVEVHLARVGLDVNDQLEVKALDRVSATGGAALPQLSADGSTLAHYARSEWDGPWTLHVRPTAGLEGASPDVAPTVLQAGSNQGWLDATPSLSADGSRVGFVAPRVVDGLAQGAPATWTAVDGVQPLAVFAGAPALEGSVDRVVLDGDGATAFFDASWGERGTGQQVFAQALSGGPTELVSAGPNGDGLVQGGAVLVDAAGNGEAVAFTAAGRGVLADTSLQDSGSGLYLAVPRTDTTPPTWPADAGLRAVTTGATVVELAWDEASDAAGIRSYRVRRDGQVVATTSAVDRDAVMSGLSPATAYVFTVEALDSFGNVSASPLTLPLTTGQAGGGMGGAALFAVTAPGGRVDLSWDTAEAGVGYRVLRAVGTGPFAAVDLVPAGTTTYRDSGLAASSAYRYRVDRVPPGRADEPHTRVVDVTTASLPPVSSVDWSSPGLKGGALPYGSKLTFAVRGETGRQAAALVGVQSWFGADGSRLQAPAGRELSVALTEDTAVPGTYRGTLDLPDGVAQVDRVKGRLSDGVGNEVAATATRTLPLPVTGSLVVDIAPGGDVSGASLEIGSPRVSLGRRLLTAAGQQPYGAVTPGEDYRLRLTDRGNRPLSDQAVAVLAGLQTVAGVTPKRYVHAAVTLLGKDRAPMAYTEVQAFDPATGDYLGSRYTDPTGVASFEGLDDRETLRLVSRASWPAELLLSPVVDTTVPVSAGENAVELAFVALPAGVVSGVVRSDGRPADGVNVVMTQRPAGQPVRTADVRTAEDGAYSFRVLAGVPLELAFSSWGGAADRLRDVVVAPGGVEQRDFVLTRPQAYRVKAKLFTTYAGEAEQPVELTSYRQVSGYDALRIVTDGVERGLPGSPEVEVLGYAGQTVRFCGGGSRLGLGAGCGPEVVLPTDRTKVVEAELHLVQRQRLEASIVDEQGQPISSWRAVLSRADGSTVPGFHGYSYSSRLSADVTEPGELSLTVSATRWFEGRNVELSSGPVPVGFGGAAKRDLGDVVLLQERSSVFRGEGNQVQSMRPGVLPGGIALLRTAFRNNGTGTVKDAVLRLQLPAGSSLAPRGVLLDGKAVEVVAEGGKVDVPVGDLAPGQGGAVLHHVVLTGTKPGDRLTAVARLVTPQREHSLGAADITVAGLTLRGPSTATSSTVQLRGEGPAERRVEIYDGDDFLGSADVSRGGTWGASVTLTDRGKRSNHPLTARTTTADGSSLTSAVLDLALDADHVTVNRMSVGQEESNMHSFDPRRGVARFPFIWAPYKPILVHVEFSDPSRVSNVVVFVGQRNAPAKLVDGVFTGEVFGDGSGNFAVEYDVAAVPMTFSSGPPTLDELRNRLPQWASGVEVTAPPVLNADESVTTGFRLPGLGATMTSTIRVKEVGQKQVSEQDAALMRDTGVPVFGVTRTFETDPVTKELTMTETAYLPRASLPAGAVKPASLGNLRALRASSVGSGLVDAVESWSKHKLGHEVGIGDVDQEFVEDFHDQVKETASEGGSKFDEVGEMYDQLADLPPADQEALRLQTDELMQTATNAELLGVASSLGLGVGAPRAPGGARAVWGAEEGRSMAIDSDFNRKKAKLERAMEQSRQRKRAKDLIKEFDELLIRMKNDLYLTCLELKAMAAITKSDPGPDCKPPPPGGGGRHRSPGGAATVIVDPSGYVYDGLPENRLAGVTATVMSGPTKDGPWTPWDAEWFGQSNPLVTGTDGRYAWDVPLGWWKVRYEKEGYATGWSEALEVLPPHFDVNEPLLPLAPPVVGDVVRTGDAITVGFSQHVLASALGASSLTVTGPDGTAVAGTVAPVDPKAAPDGRLLTRSVRWTASAPLAAGSYTVLTSGAVQSHTGRLLGDDVTRSVVVTAPPPAGGGDTGGGTDGGTGGGGTGGGTGGGGTGGGGTGGGGTGGGGTGGGGTGGGGPTPASPTSSASPSTSPSAAPSSTPSAQPTSTPSTSPTPPAGVDRGGEPGTVTPLATPVRVLDTRTTSSGARLGAFTLRLGDQVPESASSVLLNVTVTGARGPGHVVVHPGGTGDPGTSNVNFVAGQTQANLVLVRLGAARDVAFSVQGSAAHVVVDVVGELSPPSTPSFVGRLRGALGSVFGAETAPPAGVVAVTPARVLDTRSTGSARAGRTVVQLTAVPAGARAVLLNITATGAARNGHVTAHPAGSPVPPTSNVNVAARRTQANLVLVQLGADRSVALEAVGSPMHLVADLVGYQLGDVPAVTPQRLLDTRAGAGGMKGARTGAVRLRLPDSVGDASSVVLNVTVTGAAGNGHVTAHPAGAPRPATSNVNFRRGQTQANLVVVTVGADRSVVLDVHGTTAHVLADLVGRTAAGR